MPAEVQHIQIGACLAIKDMYVVDVQQTRDQHSTLKMSQDAYIAQPWPAQPWTRWYVPKKMPDEENMQPQCLNVRFGTQVTIQHL